MFFACFREIFVFFYYKEYIIIYSYIIIDFSEVNVV